MAAAMLLPLISALQAGDVAGEPLVTQRELQRVVTHFESALQRVQEQLDLLQAEKAAWQQQPPPPTTLGTTVGAGDGTVTVEDMKEGRRLTASPTYITVPAMQTHELPASHTCSNTGFSEASPQLLPVDGSGPTTHGPSTAASADVSLSAVSWKAYSVAEIQRLAAPVKLTHVSDCSTAPTAHLQLATVADGTLHVGTKPIGQTVVEAVNAGTATTHTYTTLTDIPGLTKTITLTESRMVIARYNVAAQIPSSYYCFLHTTMLVDDVEEVSTRSVGGISNAGSAQGYSQNTGLAFLTLAAGSHTIKVQGRSNSAVNIATSGTEMGAWLQVLIL